jgi:hypothetical protein
MARFYVDEDVALLLAHSLSQAGHDALTTRDAGRLGAGDHLHFLYAVQERRILITHNVSSFSLLHLAWLAWPRDERAPLSLRSQACVSPLRRGTSRHSSRSVA